MISFAENHIFWAWSVVDIDRVPWVPEFQGPSFCLDLVLRSNDGVVDLLKTKKTVVLVHFKLACQSSIVDQNSSIN